MIECSLCNKRTEFREGETLVFPLLLNIERYKRQFWGFSPPLYSTRDDYETEERRAKISVAPIEFCVTKKVYCNWQDFSDRRRDKFSSHPNSVPEYISSLFHVS